MNDFIKIKGYENYSINKNGEVFSHLSNKILKPSANKNKYLYVNLFDKQIKRIAIHVLVLTNFISERPNGFVTNHKNGIKTDNRLENLEWVTQSYNVKHAYENKLRVINDEHKKRASALGIAKRSFTNEQKEKVLNEFTGKRGQIIRLANKYNLSRYAIANIVRMQNASI